MTIAPRVNHHRPATHPSGTPMKHLDASLELAQAQQRAAKIVLLADPGADPVTAARAGLRHRYGTILDVHPATSPTGGSRQLPARLLTGWLTQLAVPATVVSWPEAGPVQVWWQQVSAARHVQLLLHPEVSGEVLDAVVTRCAPSAPGTAIIVATHDPHRAEHLSACDFTVLTVPGTPAVELGAILAGRCRRDPTTSEITALAAACQWHERVARWASLALPGPTPTGQLNDMIAGAVAAVSAVGASPPPRPEDTVERSGTVTLLTAAMAQLSPATATLLRGMAGMVCVPAGLGLPIEALAALPGLGSLERTRAAVDEAAAAGMVTTTAGDRWALDPVVAAHLHHPDMAGVAARAAVLGWYLGRVAAVEALVADGTRERLHRAHPRSRDAARTLWTTGRDAVAGLRGEQHTIAALLTPTETHPPTELTELVAGFGEMTAAWQAATAPWVWAGIAEHALAAARRLHLEGAERVHGLGLAEALLAAPPPCSAPERRHAAHLAVAALAHAQPAHPVTAARALLVAAATTDNRRRALDHLSRARSLVPDHGIDAATTALGVAHTLLTHHRASDLETATHGHAVDAARLGWATGTDDGVRVAAAAGALQARVLLPSHPASAARAAHTALAHLATLTAFDRDSDIPLSWQLHHLAATAHDRLHDTADTSAAAWAARERCLAGPGLHDQRAAHHRHIARTGRPDWPHPTTPTPPARRSPR
jgi:hypothetical protein